MRNKKWAAGLVVATWLAAAPLAAETPRVVGWIERVSIEPAGLVLEAKLDTGADTSSLHVSNMSWVTHSEGDHVQFDVSSDNGRTVRLERKVVRVVRVRSATGGSQRRPTVVLGVCLGHIYRETDVNLTDRSGFRQPFLVGRSFLARNFSVDSSLQHTVEPDCKAR